MSSKIQSCQTFNHLLLPRRASFVIGKFFLGSVMHHKSPTVWGFSNFSSSPLGGLFGGFCPLLSYSHCTSVNLCPLIAHWLIEAGVPRVSLLQRQLYLRCDEEALRKLVSQNQACPDNTSPRPSLKQVFCYLKRTLLLGNFSLVKDLGFVLILLPNKYVMPF